MTEKEAIKILRNIQNAKKVEYEDAACAAAWFSIFKYVYPEPEDYVIEEAIKALEEIQQYRKIGTVKEIKTAKKYIDLKKKCGTPTNTIDVCAEYVAIGTVEECRGAMEKQKAKKPKLKYKPRFLGKTMYTCPNCGNCCLEDFANERQRNNYCWDCGQKLDWNENLEGMENE